MECWSFWRLHRYLWYDTSGWGWRNCADFYENRTAKLKLNADLLKKIDAEYDKLEAEASEIAIEKSKSDLSSIEAIIGSKERLGMLADDIVAHYEDRQYVLTGKAMVVCMTRRIAINLYKIILEKAPWMEK